MKQFINQITLEEIADELRRELKMRYSVYPRRVSSGKMTQEIADLQILKMSAAIRFVEAELKKNANQKRLFE